MAAALIALILLNTLLSASADSSTCAVSDYAKIDCGYTGIQQNDCEAKGCCWSPAVRI